MNCITILLLCPCLGDTPADLSVRARKSEFGLKKILARIQKVTNQFYFIQENNKSVLFCTMDMLNGQKLLRKNGEVVAADEALKGGFQLLDLIITELKSRMTCYNSMLLVG